MNPLSSPDASSTTGFSVSHTAENANVRAAQRSAWCGTALRTAVSLLAFFAILNTDAEAQSYVFNNASFSTGFRPSWVMAGDFNKDGIIDIATVNQCGSDPACASGGSVSILLGKPDGTFQTAVDYPTGSGGLPRFGMVGDFNGDGIPDIAVANLGANTISILLGKGDGTFQPHVDYAVGSGPLSIAAGDFNGDGKVDLAVANSGSNSISILLGNRDGTFQTHVDFATSFAPQSVATADFNGDGHLDLVVADSNVSVLLGKGDGTFSAPMEFPGDSASFVAVGDFNGDGKMDVAATEAGLGTIGIHLGNGDGSFQTPVRYQVGSEAGSLIAIDLNGDGHLDLALGAGTVSILLNKGDGTFQPHRDFGGMRAVSVAAADFNGDGHMDVAIPNPDLNVVNILLGDGHGAFGSILDVETPVVVPTQVIARDFNGDGKLDLGMAMAASGIVGVALGNGDGTFQAPMFDNAPGGGLSIATGDFNGDGKLDVAAFVGSELNNMQMLLGNGDGTFMPRLSFPVSNNPGQVLAADLNGDGKLDLVVVGFGCNVLLGNGDGTFNAGASFASHLSNGALLADFNGDGKLDLAVVSGGSNTITIFLGNGDGTFQAGVDYATGTTNTSPVGIVAADFNGDGKLDLAVANAATNTVSVFLGNGDGTFQTNTDSPVVQGPRSLAAADFDGDGKTDLAVVGSGFSYLLGKGDGTFQPHVDYLTSISVTSAIAADFNGDGRSDLAVASGFASVVINRPALALHPAQLSFPSQVVGTASQPQTITLSNPGIVPLTVQSVVASSNFSETDNCVGSLKAGSSCVLNVTFKPTASGSQNGTLTISDDAMGSPQTISLTGTGADFSLAAATGGNCPAGGNCSVSAMVTDGQTATYNLQASSLGGFTGTVTLGCTGAPSLAVCTVTPNSVTLNGSSSTAFTVTVTTTAPSVMTPLAAPREWPPTNLQRLVLPLLLALLMFALQTRFGTKAFGRRLRFGCALSTISVCLVTAWGCSGGGGVHNPGTPKGTSTLTITGSSGGVSRTVDLKLTVN